MAPRASWGCEIQPCFMAEFFITCGICNDGDYGFWFRLQSQIFFGYFSVHLKGNPIAGDMVREDFLNFPFAEHLKFVSSMFVWRWLSSGEVSQ